MRTLIAATVLTVLSVLAIPAFLPAGVTGSTAGQPAGGGQSQGLRRTEPRPLFADVPPGGHPTHGYAPGHCTWWAAYNRPLPAGLGDAWQWLDGAARRGLPTSSEPALGAVVVYRRSPAYDPTYGHVAVVVAVGADSFRVSEMNFLGLGVVDERDSPWPDGHVLGFILLERERPR